MLSSESKVHFRFAPSSSANLKLAESRRANCDESTPPPRRERLLSVIIRQLSQSFTLALLCCDCAWELCAVWCRDETRRSIDRLELSMAFVERLADAPRLQHGLAQMVFETFFWLALASFAPLSRRSFQLSFPASLHAVGRCARRPPATRSTAAFRSLLHRIRPCALARGVAAATRHPQVFVCRR